MLFEAGHLYDLACQPCLNSQPLSPLSSLSPLPPMSPLSPVSLSPLAQPPAFGTCLVRKEEDQESHILGIRMRGRQLSTITNKQTTKTNIQHSHPDGCDIPRIRETCVLENGCRKPESGYYALTILDLLSAQNQHHRFNTQLLPFSPDGSVEKKKIFLWGFSNQNMVFTPKQTITKLVQE